MAATWLWVRSEWRRRWGALLALGLLVSFAGGVTLAVAAGARRADTAIDRFMDETNQHELEVELPFPDDIEEALVQLRSVPGAAELADRFIEVPGVRGVTATDWIGVAPGDVEIFFNAAIGAERGLAPGFAIVEGRAADPDEPNEVLLAESAVDAWDAPVGATLHLRTLAPDQLERMAGLSMDEPAGPDIDVRVVGVLRSIEDITDAPEPFLVATPAFVEEYADQVFAMRGNIMVNADPRRLEDVQEGLQAAAGDDFIVGPVDEDFAGRIDETVSVEVTALWVFGLVAAVAGAGLVFQSMSRQADQFAPDYEIRRALGLTRRAQLGGSVLAVAPALIIGVAGSALLSVALSPLLPRGLAARAEPTPGLRVDGTVILLGSVALVVLTLAMTAGAAWLATQRENARTVSSVGVLGRLTAALPPVPGLGVRLALAPAGRWSQAGWAGAIGAGLLVAGLVTVATIDRSVDHLMSTPRLFGANVDVVLGLEPGEDPDPIVDRVAADPDVAAVGLREMLAGDPTVTARGPGGEGPVEPEVLRSVVGTIPGTVTGGRLPTGPGEVAIGATVATRLGAEIGDTIEVDGRSGPVRMVVVGRLITAGGDELGDGFALTSDGLGALRRDCAAGSDDVSCRIVTQGIGVVFRPGADVDATMARLTEIDDRFEAFPLPSVVNNLRQIGSTPWLLAGFLVVLGAAGLTHALVVGSRRRSRYLAITRALGLRPRQAAGAVHWQAVALAVAGAAAGLVLGAVVGRFIWRRVAEGTGALVEIVVPLSAAALAVAVAVAAAAMVAVVPAVRVARVRPAEILRTE
jgi:hypothetical protein